MSSDKNVRAVRLDFCSGSKCEELNVSTPLCPIERTSMERAATPLMGHQRKGSHRAQSVRFPRRAVVSTPHG